MFLKSSNLRGLPKASPGKEVTEKSREDFIQHSTRYSERRGTKTWGRYYLPSGRFQYIKGSEEIKKKMRLRIEKSLLQSLDIALKNIYTDNGSKISWLNVVEKLLTDSEDRIKLESFSTFSRICSLTMIV